MLSFVVVLKVPKTNLYFHIESIIHLNRHIILHFLYSSLSMKKLLSRYSKQYDIAKSKLLLSLLLSLDIYISVHSLSAKANYFKWNLQTYNYCKWNFCYAVNIA